ncbi:TNFAIP3-interacting protein 3-like isoform X2 [Scomber scombrus]|uniref:TNFAIP3-interacting protein 3-like isoform X2 n=1 Tax=Scomber scombrus TaxID=13677 RepID=A0AAV1P793_SCOSC
MSPPCTLIITLSRLALLADDWTETLQLLTYRRYPVMGVIASYHHSSFFTARAGDHLVVLSFPSIKSVSGSAQRLRAAAEGIPRDDWTMLVLPRHSGSSSLHKTRRPTARSQAREAAPTVGTQNEHKHIHRLYPSLPNVDRYEVCVLNGSSEENEKTKAAAVYHPAESLLEDTQSEVSATNCDANMKAQILIMEKQKQELLSINERWAKEYRIMVQYYQDKVRDLKALLQHNNFHSKEEETHIALYKKSNVKTVIEEESTQAGNGDVNAEVLRAEREAKELRAHNSTLTRKGLHQQEEIKRLNKALEETFITTKPLAASNETLQDVWKHQAEIYKEDFLKERKDREILKGKCLELEKGLRKAHKEVHVLKSQASTRPPQSVFECNCKHTPDQHHIGVHRRHTLDERR